MHSRAPGYARREHQTRRMDECDRQHHWRSVLVFADIYAKQRVSAAAAIMRAAGSSFHSASPVSPVTSGLNFTPIMMSVPARSLGGPCFLLVSHRRFRPAGGRRVISIACPSRRRAIHSFRCRGPSSFNRPRRRSSHGRSLDSLLHYRRHHLSLFAGSHRPRRALHPLLPIRPHWHPERASSMATVKDRSLGCWALCPCNPLMLDFRRRCETSQEACSPTSR